MRKLATVIIIELICGLIISCNSNVSMTSTPTPTEEIVSPPPLSITPTLIFGETQNVPVLCTLMNRPYTRYYPNNRPIMLSWGWSAATQDQIYDFIDNTETRITLDNEVISDGLFYEIRHEVDGGPFEVFWARNIGVMALGSHLLIYDVKFTNRISDGERSYGPGTDIITLHDECRLFIYLH
jgi:hypothetical protein